MIDFDVLLQSFALIFRWEVIAACFGGVVWGMFVGVTPGLTGIMAVVIALPLTFFMDPQSAIALLLGIYVTAIYGGSVTAIMIATPGAPPTPPRRCSTATPWPARARPARPWKWRFMPRSRPAFCRPSWPW